MRDHSSLLKVNVLSRPTVWIVSPVIVLFVVLPLLFLARTPDAHASALPWLMVGPILLGVVVGLITEAITTFVVGNDGVLVKRRGNARFLPFAAIAEVIEIEDDLCIVLRSGEKVTVRTSRAENAPKVRYVERLDELVARIRRGAEACAPVDDDAPRSALSPNVLLQRARSGLRGAALDGGAYRETELPAPEILWKLVDDPGSDPKARAAAAVALRSDPAAGPRLRVASEHTASPSLRTIFRLAADASPDARIADALDEIDRSEPKVGARSSFVP